MDTISVILFSIMVFMLALIMLLMFCLLKTLEKSVKKDVLANLEEEFGKLQQWFSENQLNQEQKITGTADKILDKLLRQHDKMAEIEAKLEFLSVSHHISPDETGKEVQHQGHEEVYEQYEDFGDPEQTLHAGEIGDSSLDEDYPFNAETASDDDDSDFLVWKVQKNVHVLPQNSNNRVVHVIQANKVIVNGNVNMMLKASGPTQVGDNNKQYQISSNKDTGGISNVTADPLETNDTTSSLWTICTLILVVIYLNTRMMNNNASHHLTFPANKSGNNSQHPGAQSKACDVLNSTELMPD